MTVISDISDHNGSPSGAVRPADCGTPRRHMHPRNRRQTPKHQDGSVSDSVANSPSSQRSRKQVHERHFTQPTHVSNFQNTGKTNGQKQRPLSTGGNPHPTTPAKEQAYAGPRFQASPAPSSLPLPKFFSKSVPNVAPLQERMENGMISGQEQSSPEPDPVAPVVPSRESQQSPLDVFFQADRAEKEKNRNSGSHLSPVSTASQTQQQQHNPFQDKIKRDSITEMGGGLNPKTVQSNRRPGPPERANSSPTTVSGQDQNKNELHTQSLKDLLFHTASQHESTSPGHSSTPHQARNDFNTPSPVQRTPDSAMSSTEQQKNYSLHYGNRNLSPLFKAARNDTPPRSSNLRQEIGWDESPRPQSHYDATKFDTNRFSRNYLDEHIRSANPTTFAQPAFMAGQQQQHQQQLHHQGVGQDSSPSTTPRVGGPDIRSMEDDLRRMLKLNVLS